MKIEQKETPFLRASNHFEMIYWHCLPAWVRFVVFMNRGFFNGHVSRNWKRIFCWFGSHEWGIHKYMIWEDEKETKKYTRLCRRCCMGSKIYSL